MIPVISLLLVAAFIITLVSAMGKSPLWPAVLLIIVALLVQTTGALR